jgi:hypothetical protein
MQDRGFYTVEQAAGPDMGRFGVSDRCYAASWMSTSENSLDAKFAECTFFEVGEQMA